MDMRRTVRLMSLVVALTAIGACGSGGDGGTEPTPPPTPVPTSLQLSATSVSLRMGETRQLTATVLDQLNRPMSAQTIAWSSTDTTKVTMDGTGLARGVRPGTATLTATSGQLTATAAGSVLAPQLVVEDGASVTMAIGSAGGSVSAQGTGGAHFTLNVPAAALLESVDVSLTPITTIQNLPTGATLVAAVRLRPDGLTFLSPATLTIDLPTVSSATNLVGLRFGDDGSALRLTPITRAGTRLTLHLSHFSGAGAANTSNPPLVPLTGGGTVADDAKNALMIAELNAQAAGGSYDIPQITAIFRTWFISGVKTGLLGAATDESRLGPAIAGWAEWRDAIVTFQPTIAGVLDAALSAEQAEARSLAATALQAAIQRNNATCMAQQDLAAARRALGWQWLAESHALATVANALDRASVLAGLCVKVQFAQLILPSTVVGGQPATLRVQAGLKFGPTGPVYLSSPRVDVRITATGATVTTPQHYPTDATGVVQTTLTPVAPGPLGVAIHACIDDPVGFGLTLADVCFDAVLTASIGGPPRVRILNMGGLRAYWAQHGNPDCRFFDPFQPSPPASVVYPNADCDRPLTLNGTQIQARGSSDLLATLSGLTTDLPSVAVNLGGSVNIVGAGIGTFAGGSGTLGFSFSVENGPVELKLTGTLSATMSDNTVDSHRYAELEVNGGNVAYYALAGRRSDNDPLQPSQVVVNQTLTLQPGTYALDIDLVASGHDGGTANPHSRNGNSRVVLNVAFVRP